MTKNEYITIVEFNLVQSLQALREIDLLTNYKISARALDQLRHLSPGAMLSVEGSLFAQVVFEVDQGKLDQAIAWDQRRGGRKS